LDLIRLTYVSSKLMITSNQKRRYKVIAIEMMHVKGADQNYLLLRDLQR